MNHAIHAVNKRGSSTKLNAREACDLALELSRRVFIPILEIGRIISDATSNSPADLAATALRWAYLESTLYASIRLRAATAARFTVIQRQAFNRSLTTVLTACMLMCYPKGTEDEDPEEVAQERDNWEIMFEGLLAERSTMYAEAQASLLLKVYVLFYGPRWLDSIFLARNIENAFSEDRITLPEEAVSTFSKAVTQLVWAVCDEVGA